MSRAILHSVRELGSSALPSLRVVALVYTGLGGFAALFLVLAVALMPRSPIIDQVTEPARQVVTSLVVQPTSDLVTGLVGSPLPIVVVRPPAQPTAVPFVATISFDVVIEDEAEPVTVPAPTLAFAPRITRYMAPSAPVVEEQPSEDELPPAPELGDPAPSIAEAVVESAPPEMHEANAEPPKPLPTPVPTLTPGQLKAQQEAVNAAVIAANKAAQAQAKADAAAANRAAIEALKAAATTDDQAMADASLTIPHAQPTLTPKASADAAKAAALAAKAQADAGNRAAIDAAKAAKAASQAAAAAKSAKH